MKIESRWFTLEELCFSEYAARNGIANKPDEREIAHLQFLASNLLDPLREHVGTPIIVTSGYRSPALNKGVGGSLKSQHMQGLAADIRAVGYSARSLFEEIWYCNNYTSNLNYLDQCILEFDSWVHVSVERFDFREEFLIARKVTGVQNIRGEAMKSYDKIEWTLLIIMGLFAGIGVGAVIETVLAVT